jgi:hypothetical protein
MKIANLKARHFLVQTLILLAAGNASAHSSVASHTHLQNGDVSVNSTYLIGLILLAIVLNLIFFAKSRKSKRA